MPGRESHKKKPVQPPAISSAVAAPRPSRAGSAAATLDNETKAGPRYSPGFAIFFTGLPAAGKTTLACELGSRLSAAGYRLTMLDGGEVRTRLSPDLGFSRSDREANLRRVGLIAAEVVRHGGIVICSFIAPFEQSRREIRESVQQHGKFFLVYVSTPVEECERRDPKGLYRKARAGLLASFTGVSDVYEAPTACEIAIDTTGKTLSESADQVARRLATKGLPAGLWLASRWYLAEKVNPNQGHIHAPALVPNEERRARLFQCVLRATAGRRMTLNEVAREVGIERHTIERVVRLSTGRSFRQFQQTLLLERAKTLLDQGKSIKEVAFELGFGHPQSFHRFVRRSSGTTPLSLAAKSASVPFGSSLCHSG